VIAPQRVAALKRLFFKTVDPRVRFAYPGYKTGAPSARIGEALASPHPGHGSPRATGSFRTARI